MDIAICPHELISDEKVTCNKMWPYTCTDIGIHELCVYYM